jgi:hypothetical protein
MGPLVAVPATGVAHVPLVLALAEPQSIGPEEYRTSYLAACPVPSLTCVKESVADVSSVAVTIRSETVPGGSLTIGVPVAPEHTANAGRNATHAHRRTVDLAGANMCFTGTPLPCLVCRRPA